MFVRKIGAFLVDFALDLRELSAGMFCFHRGKRWFDIGLGLDQNILIKVTCGDEEGWRV